MSTRWSLAVIAAVLLIAVACGGSGDSDATPTATLTQTDLAAMAFPDAPLEVEGVEFVLDPDESGPRTAEEVLGDSFDPADDEADMAEYGWRANYAQTFNSTDGGESPLFGLATALTLNDSEEHAAADLLDELKDAQASIGNSNGNGQKLVAAAVFDTPRLDGGKGLVLTIESSNGVEYYATYVAFARGPVVAAVLLANLDDTKLETAAEDLALELEALVSAALE